MAVMSLSAFLPSPLLLLLSPTTTTTNNNNDKERKGTQNALHEKGNKTQDRQKRTVNLDRNRCRRFVDRGSW
jgi:hypothetical protein